MKFLDHANAIDMMNQLGKARTPFLFITNFNTTNNVVLPLDEVDPLKVAYDFQGQQSNIAAFQEIYSLKVDDHYAATTPIWQYDPLPFEHYHVVFKALMAHLQSGSSHLANLTFPTPVKCNLTLPEIFARTTAKYRILLKDHFCSFSPETFITINNGVIATYPMKGTINAAILDAEKQLLDNPKEIDEHRTMTQEAMRDIALIAKNVRISRFRYVDKIERGDGAILQTSSIIEGDLPLNFHDNIGDLLYKILPASSITGAPKSVTTEILQHLETYNRGFYSGVAGIYDGVNLDSTVLIRYLEKNRDAPPIKPSVETDPCLTVASMRDHEDLFQYTFKSGGGITAMSQAEHEYDELIEKIYLPIS